MYKDFINGEICIEIKNKNDFNCLINKIARSGMFKDYFPYNATWSKIIEITELPINKMRFGGFKGSFFFYFHYEHGLSYYLTKEEVERDMNLPIYQIAGITL